MANKVSITEAWLKRHAANPDKDKPPLFSEPGLVQERWWDDGTPGFGVVIGKRFATFIVQHRVNGKQTMHTIGRFGQPMEDGQTCTVERAYKKARVLLGAMAGGVDPVATEHAAEVTLRDAFETHKRKLEKKLESGERSQATIDTIDKTMARKEVQPLLDRPIAELTGDSLSSLHEQIKRNVKPRTGARNKTGSPVANRVVVNISAAWNSMNKKLGGKLGNWNPAKSVERDTLLKGTRKRIENLHDWNVRVQTMKNPIQRDGLLFALYTGLRNEDVRTARFEHVDEDEATLRLPDPKGGPGAAFAIPLSKTCLEIIERRRKDNAKDLAHGDGGWIFPGLNSDGEVGPIGDLRQQMHVKVDEERTKHTRFPVEDVHTLRRTYLSIAAEAGIPELDQHVLSNHSFGSRNVNSSYVAQHIDHLARCQAKIEAAIGEAISNPPKPATKKRHLKAVS